MKKRFDPLRSIIAPSTSEIPRDAGWDPEMKLQ